MTEFIMKCIMIIEREKANGTLTELAGEDIIEFLSITCDYLFKNEPDLYKEVHEIMNPRIKLTRERADEMIKLQREIVEEERAKAEEERAKAEEERAKAEAEREKAEAEAAKAEREAAKAAEAIEKIECSIRNFIQLGQQNGQSFQETQQTMQNIFSISETEAEEKMKAYWNMDCEV
ncbi:MAG: hypothetical protein HDR71_05725 [Lachnospiraceae bacterium]|nr:hypothetical protein [Lachnospiraceae bacterium]